ncbi:MAG: nucleotidyltransferase [Clostridia bacterium]|nr:nucleotidyltransferase [Clostridia bacterium]
MAKPVLVLMAAGLGSRFGGLKQMQPMDSEGHLLIDFSVYDAVKAGFEDIVFIIKREMEQDFTEKVLTPISRHANTSLAFQDVTMLPQGIRLPEGRTKPLGTTHAILCASDAIANRPFAAINADDYYGPRAFELLYRFLSADGPDNEHFMVSYLLENTLSPSGPVSRGVCAIEDGYLSRIVERKKILPHKEGGQFTDQDGNTVIIPTGTPVSMNCWGFRPGIMPALYDEFTISLKKGLAEDPLKYEDILPTAIQTLMAKGAARVKAEDSHDRWFGVTYKEDMPSVTADIAALKQAGMYPAKLWK